MLALLIDFLHSSVIIVASPHNNDDVSHESVGAQEHHSPGVFCPPSAPVPSALHHPPPRLFWSFLASKHSPLKSGGYLDVVSSSATDRHHAIAMVSMRAVSTQLLVPFSGTFVALCVVPRKWSVTEFCCFVVFSSNIVPTTRCLSPFPLDTPQLQKLKKHYHRQTGTSSLFRLWHKRSSLSRTPGQPPRKADTCKAGDNTFPDSSNPGSSLVHRPTSCSTHTPARGFDRKRHWPALLFTQHALKVLSRHEQLHVNGLAKAVNGLAEGQPDRDYLPADD
ncbi:hypothetical protein HBI54_230930 [Parastagonospora nodorum]|nr:hypothetical protein HBI54_230930 [Parastagonospora nodorum]